jgi:hypothetical protein
MVALGGTRLPYDNGFVRVVMGGTHPKHRLVNPAGWVGVIENSKLRIEN